jgi:HEAT repeat protein
MVRLFFILLCFGFTMVYSHPTAAYTDEELAEMEKRRLEQALENLGSAKYELVENSAYKFEQMGEESIIHLLKLMRENEDDSRIVMNTIYVLGRLGIMAKRAVPVLIPYLESENADIRAVTVIALGKIGYGARDAVPTIITLLEDEDTWVARSAATALTRIRTKQALEAAEKYNKEQKIKMKKKAKDNAKQAEEAKKKNKADNETKPPQH